MSVQISIMVQMAIFDVFLYLHCKVNIFQRDLFMYIIRLFLVPHTNGMNNILIRLKTAARSCGEYFEFDNFHIFTICLVSSPD